MNKPIVYQDELNSAQLEAVTSTEGPYLVIAGAGSGKTRVLVYRVAYLVEKGVNPEEILLLTFTRKAASEMLRRASLIIDERCQKVPGGTFHSFANMVLRKYAQLLGLKNNFSIMDESDAEDVINLVRNQLGLNKMDKRFPRKKAILDIISKSINKSEDIEDTLYIEYPQFDEWSKEIKRIKDAYERYKRDKSLLDYDDLLVFLKQLLVLHPQVRARLSSKYKYIMVDEYQDTNKLQAYIVCLLASEHKNIMVVGDDSQSIYAFRGANFRNIIDFPKIFEGTKVITLEENYRSSQPILDLTNEVINSAAEKFKKMLYTRNGGQELPVYVEVPNESAQSKYIADKIEELQNNGVGLADISVLFRSGWHSNDLEIELASRNIPFAKFGGIKFVEASHVKDIIAHLRIAYNFHDIVSWNRVLLLLPGVGAKTAEKIVASLNLDKDGLKVDEQFLKKSHDLKKLMEILNKLDLNKFSPAEIMRVFLEYYQPLLRLKYDDFNKRLNDLESLERIVSRYSSFELFLADMALEPPEKSFVENELKNDSRLTLSTIHSAKGLEWHTVFLIFVAEGHLPSYRSLDDKEGIEEERRLFYVATTRAKESLFLIKPNIDQSFRSMLNSGASIFTEQSRFINEGKILNNLVIVEKIESSLDTLNSLDRKYSQEARFRQRLDEFLE